MKSFEYLRPKSVAELVKLLSRYDGKARLLAGGTDLLVMMKQGTIQPEYLISLKDIPKLAGIRELRDGRVKIGAMTLLREIERSDLLQKPSFPYYPRPRDGSVLSRFDGGPPVGETCLMVPHPLT